MRLLHTADLHLGKILHEQSLLDDQEVILDQIVRELSQGSYDVFVVAGDVFDRSVPPPEAVALWDRFLHRVETACPDLTTIVIPGNHDGPVRLSFAASFLATHRIHVRTKNESLDEPIRVLAQGQEWDIFAVPFLQAGGLGVKTGEEAVLRSQRDLWEEARHRLEAARRPGVPSILVAHLFSLGGAESDSERLFLGEAEQVPSAWLSGWEYVALGHLHRAQEPAPGIRYSGSPLAYSFSEAGPPKSLTRWVDGVVTEVQLTPRRPLSRLQGTFDEFTRGDAGEECRDHWLEITLADPALVPGALEHLRNRFPGLLSLVQAPLQNRADLPETVRRRTGDLTADALRFLAEVGVEVPPETAPWLADQAREVQNETP